MPQMTWPSWRRTRTVTRVAGEVKLMYGEGDAMEPVWVGTKLVEEAQLRKNRGGPSSREEEAGCSASTGRNDDAGRADGARRGGQTCSPTWRAEAAR